MKVNEQMKEFMHNLQKQLQTIKYQPKALIFTGLTGSGKGTLIHYLINDRNLNAQMSDLGDIIIKLKRKFNSVAQKITISERMSSDTSMPFEAEYRGQVYRDLPGFMDNRNQQNLIPQDIINSFFIQQVYQKTEKIKIIFTTSKYSLTDRAIQFVKSLNQFTQRFQSIHEIKRSIILVVTKSPQNLCIKNIKSILQRIINQLNKQIPQKSKQLINMWLYHEQMIQIFKVPEKQGSLSFKDADRITQSINKIEYSSSPQIMNVISQYSQAKMAEIEERWNQIIGKLSFNIVQMKYEQYLKRISKIDQLNTAKSILNSLRHKVDQLMGAQNSEKFKVLLRNISQTEKFTFNNKIAELMKQYEEYYDLLHFFSKIQPFTFNILKWKQPLYKIHHNISQLVAEPWEQIHGQDIYIKGFVVESEIVQKKLAPYKKKDQPRDKAIKKIVIFAYFFFMNEDIEYQGANMMIFAQYFIVKDMRAKIRLNGQNAKDYGALTDNNNMHGQPGRPGQNGGNFLLKVYEKCQQVQKFSVDVRGGRGGRGKNGGEINLKKGNKIHDKSQFYGGKFKADINLPTDRKSYLQYREDLKFEDRNIIGKIGEILRMLGTYNGQVVQFYSTQNKIISDFQREGKTKQFQATLGGIGGKPGFSGKPHIDIGEYTICIIDEPEPSENGFGHAEVYQGLYVKQMVFSNFREEGKQINKKKKQLQLLKIQQQQRLAEQNRKRRQKNIENLAKQTLRQLMTYIQQNNQQEPAMQSHIKNHFNGEEMSKIITSQINQKVSQQIIDQIKEEQNGKIPLRFKTNYKQQFDYVDNQSVIQEQQEQNQNDDDLSTKQMGPIHESKSRKQITWIGNKIQKPAFQQDLNIIKRSKVSRKLSFTKTDLNTSKHKIVNEHNHHTDEKQSLNKSSLKRSIFKSNVQNENNRANNQTKAKIVTEIGKEMATQVGTDAAQKLAKRFINKFIESMVRGNIIVSQQVLRQVQTKIVSQLGKKQFGQSAARLTVQKLQKDILTQLGKQVVRDGATLLERQAAKRIGQDVAKSGLKQFGKQAYIEGQIQIASKSLSSGAAYEEGMLIGLGKSVAFQLVLSFIFASGITDGWLIQPHFQSKKVDLKLYNSKNIQEPDPFKDFTKAEISAAEQEYQFFVNGFKQFKPLFADKI